MFFKVGLVQLQKAQSLSSHTGHEVILSQSQIPPISSSVSEEIKCLKYKFLMLSCEVTTLNQHKMK